MSSSKAININKQYSTLWLNGGLDEAECNPNKLRVDLRVAGGALIKKRLCVLGNVEVLGSINGSVLCANTCTNLIYPIAPSTNITIGGNITLDPNYHIISVFADLTKIRTNCISELISGSGVNIQGPLKMTGNSYILSETVSSETVFANVVNVGELITGKDILFQNTGDLVLNPSGNICLNSADNETLLKDNVIVSGNLCANKNILTDYIKEKTLNKGVYIDGVLIKDGVIYANIIGNVLTEVLLSGNNITANTLNMTCGNISNVNAMFVDQLFSKNSTTSVNVNNTLNIIDTGASESGKVTFESGIEIGNATTISINSDGIAIGKGASASGVESIALGQNASVSEDHSVQIGEATDSTTDATLKFRSQIIADESWIGGGVTVASIDNSGNIIRTTASLWLPTADSNLDMFCYNVSNVQALYADQMFGKDSNSPIQLENSIHIRNVETESGNITFEAGILIGDSTTRSSEISTIAIGKGAIALNEDQVSFGNPLSTNLTANATVWGQIFQNRAWDNTEIKVAGIDADGSFFKTTFNVADLGLWIPIAQGNLDMFCYNVSNIQAIFVDQFHGKNNSPINVNDILNMNADINFMSGSKITFQSGIEIGTNAEASTTSIAIGLSAGSVGVGGNNINLGENAGNSITTGSNNITIGLDSDVNAVDDIDAIAIGQKSVAGDNAIAIGGGTGVNTSLASAHRSIAMGWGANAITGASAIAIGSKAVTSGLNAIGLGVLTTSSDIRSIAIGYSVECSAQDAIAIGTNALVSGDEGIAIGTNAGGVGGVGKYGIAIGTGALLNSTGQYNMAFGENAGNFITTGNNNIIIGLNSDVNAADDIDAIAIGQNSIAGDGAIALGKLSSAYGTNSIAIGNDASALASHCVQLGEAIDSTTGATLKFRSQTIAYESWIGGGVTGASIDESGDIIRTTAGNLDMFCYNVSNVQSMSVDQIFGKTTNSSIQLENSINIGNTETESGNIKFVGGIAIDGIASASTDTAIGKGAVASGGDSVAIGQNSSVVSADSIAIGINCYVGPSSAYTKSVAIGDNSRAKGSNCVSIGSFARSNNGGQANNVVIGANALTTSSSIVAIGANTSVTGANQSVVIGRYARSSTANSIAIGGGTSVSLGAAVNTGTEAIAIGNDTLTRSTNSISLGTAAYVSTGSDGSIAIGAGATISTGNTNSIVIGTGITSTETGGLFLGHRGPGVYTVNNGGFIAGTNELVEVTSSRVHKDQIRDLENVSSVFDQLRPVRYVAKPGHGDNRQHIGLIAEEVEEIFPEFATYDSDGVITGLVFDRMVAVLIQEIKSLRSRETTRDTTIEELRNEINSLKEN